MKIEGQAIDVAAWVGTYPFRHLQHCSVVDLRRQMEKSAIGWVIVSHFNCLFNEDSPAAYLRAVEEVGEVAGLELWPVINPSRPSQLSNFDRCLDIEPARGLRLLPNYHGYSLADPCVGELVEWAVSRGMIIQVFQQIADVRWQWMLTVPPVPLPELLNFCTTYTAAKILLSGVDRLAALAPVFPAGERLYADTSRLRGPQFAVENVVKSIPVDRLVFGSLWPLQITEATLWQIRSAAIPPAERRQIMHENAMVLLGSSHV